MVPTPTRRWRRVVVIALLAGLLLAAGVVQAANPRYAGIVIDADTHEILYAENADESRYPASLTKMMTLYLLFEALEERRLSLGQPLPVSSAAAAMPATKLWLQPGDSIPVEKAIQALVVRSANDVAVVVAESLGGSEEHFARMMTDKARELGMADTTFRNASGLPDARQVTTARDMVVLSRRLMLDFPRYYPYFSLQRFTWRGKTHTGHNRLLANYPGADGLKTGFIRASGFNVATSARRGGRRMLSVVMGGFTASSRDEHMSDLLDRGFMRASLADGYGWLASTDISGGQLMSGPGAPMSSPLPAGQRLARLDAPAPSPSTPERAAPALAATAVRPSRVETLVPPASAAPVAETSVIAATSPSPVATVASVPASPSPVATVAPVSASPSPVDSHARPSMASVSSSTLAASAPAQGSAADPIRELVAEDEAPVGGAWGVQVGAFSDAEHARSLASRAAERLTSELADARVAVPRVEGAGVYRARLVDMQETQARSACRRLEAQGMDCMVVSL